MDGRQPLCDIQRQHIQGFVTEKMVRQKFSWKTSLHLRNLVSRIFTTAVEWDSVLTLPSHQYLRPMVDQFLEVVMWMQLGLERIYPRRTCLWVFLTPSLVSVLEMRKLAAWSSFPGIVAIEAILYSPRIRN